LNILVSTSGDTGSAAIEAIKERKNMKIVVLFPMGHRISLTQQRQMTTILAENVVVFGVNGSFFMLLLLLLLLLLLIEKNLFI